MHASQLVSMYCSKEAVDLLNKREYGKLMGEAVSQPYVRDLINKYFDLLPSLEDRNKNESGYDLRYGKLRIQVKFRSVDGKTPYSRNVHNETTRRNSVKNEGKISSGHVAYSDDEFDAIFVILCHNASRKSDDWYYSLVPVNMLISPESPNQLLTQIPSQVLKDYSDWKSTFEGLYEKLNK